MVKKGVMGIFFFSLLGDVCRNFGICPLLEGFLLPPLPVDGKVQAVEGRLGRMVLQLSQEGEVIGGDVWVRASGDAVIYQPLGLKRTHKAQHVHVGLGEENVIDHTLEQKE